MCQDIKRTPVHDQFKENVMFLTFFSLTCTKKIKMQILLSFFKTPPTLSLPSYNNIFPSYLMMSKSSPVRCTILALVAVAYKREQHRNTFKGHRCGAGQTPSEG